MAEAFVFNMDTLVTQDYLDARFSEQDAGIDARFVEQDARLEKRFSKIDLRFIEQGNQIDVLTSDMNGKFRLIFWMLSALIAANAAILPMVYKLVN